MHSDRPLTIDQKADFSGIYDQPDPRPYFRALGPLDYQIPQQALPVVQQVLARSQRSGRPRQVLDVCCSYGINGALLRYDVDLDQMAAHYSSPESAGLSTEELVRADARLYPRSTRRDVPVLGLDASRPAIDYATDVGLMDGGWAEDLENDEPSAELAAGVADVGLILCTGGVGYIGAPTFDRVMRQLHEAQDAWLVSFVLRAFGYDAVAETLSQYGLVTEEVPDVTFLQRRFADAAEQDAAVRDVLQRGLDPAGKEADGWFHATCYITRPTHEVARTPLSQLLAGAVLP